MFLHNFKYSLKTLLRNKGLIFWTFAFPIILGTLFNLAFSDIENKETLDIIDIAIVNNENLSLAIGKKGINIKLASRLTKYRINVKTLDQVNAEGNEN